MAFLFWKASNFFLAIKMIPLIKMRKIKSILYFILQVKNQHVGLTNGIQNWTHNISFHYKKDRILKIKKDQGPKHPTMIKKNKNLNKKFDKI